MTYLVPQITALLFALILAIYSTIRSIVVPSQKNVLFQLTFRVTVISMVITIISILLIDNVAHYPILLVEFFHILDFLVSPLIVVAFLYYIIATYFDFKQTKKYLRILAIPYIIYALIVLSNSYTNVVFEFSDSLVYQQNAGFISQYIISAFYLMLMPFFVFSKNVKVDSQTKAVLLTFPTLAIILVVIEVLIDGYILSGTAATSALLIVYLNLHNNRGIVDNLTGLQNREAFLSRLEILLSQKHNFKVLVVSLNDFKLFNDRFGQLSGDVLLQEISRYLKIILPIESIYRYYGDEFIFIIQDETKVNVDIIAQKLEIRFNQPWIVNQVSYQQYASIAIVSVFEHAKTFKDVISLMEYCVSISKIEGKNKAIFSDLELVSANNQRNKLIETVQSALYKSALDVYFQPIYNLKKQSYTTAEALLRVKTEVMGEVSITDFINIAEETDVIYDLFYFVLEKVCQFLSSEYQSAITLGSVSINCSQAQILQPNLVKKTLNIIEHYHVDPNRIRLEITERTFVSQSDYIYSVMQELSAAGIKFYLDDFGSGYSNLSTVVQLPFEFIKIDSSLLHEAKNSEKSLKVLEALVSVFDTIGMKVVIEGVETLELLQTIQHLPIEYVQGFYFAKPMPLEKLLEFETNVI